MRMPPGGPINAAIGVFYFAIVIIVVIGVLI